MFFVLSKIIWALLAPLNLIFLLLLAGGLLSFFSRTRLLGRSVMILGMALFVVAGIVPLGEKMLAGLENNYQRPSIMPERVDGILVLGGSFETAVSKVRGTSALNDSAERLFAAVALSRQYPQAIVVFSGGNGHLRSDNVNTESEDMALFLKEFGVPDDNFIYEGESRNTYQNFVLSKDLVLPQPGETWLLVTSAFHMTRAMAIADTVGWQLIAYPVDFRTTGKGNWLPDGFGLLASIYNLHVAVREYIGLLAYQLSGRISLQLR